MRIAAVNKHTENKSANMIKVWESINAYFPTQFFSVDERQNAVEHAIFVLAIQWMIQSVPVCQ